MDRLVLLVVDPWTLFLYWQLTPRRQEMLRGYLGLSSSQPFSYALRLWGGRGEGGLQPLAFLEGLPPEGRHYFYGLLPGTLYRVELGYLQPGGTFLTLLSSSTLALPPSSAFPEETAPDVQEIPPLALPFQFSRRS